MKRLLLIAVALVAGCAAPGAGTGPPNPPKASAASGAPVAACPEEGARVEFSGTDAAMGLRASGLYLVNCGKVPYQVEGYPVLRALDEKRAPLEIKVLRGAKEIAAIPGDVPPAVVIVLQPGERAGAAVVWRNTYDDTSHAPVTVSYLEVAPGAGRPVQVVTPEAPLDLGSTGRLGVTAWKKATTPGGVR